ncbi:MTOR-associated protein MEAK7 isoform X1 [Sciurus carolinensis]|uniref:MTOR-associated protein MEAK7 isoform X1 n=1 Tax=Sciurus carolinensis TaxID=30640 RepID=UPI001FB4A3B2|nr:MTOR-associated protein MEAK7 isoform X1 [Sciurus carolinensis]XP_047383326.1 MTOR-associated protein MEAK7 isoform X1 [Sciurus carolinensis]XP_047383327.1 MTOR-associated protein MEAK7 isoform X1 [Sciurus carolinensis]XP_047383328.1 MTOR-associated protein MEAK7 isoform X1 [Sciurus carolinensis]
MGNSRSRAEPERCPQFLPEEQAEVDSLFDALSSGEDSSEPSSRSFSLRALKNHIGEALPPEMVTRLYDGMQRVNPTRSAHGPSQGVSQEQFTVSMSHLLKGNSEEKSLMILKMISAKEGPVTVRELQQFTEDLVGSVEHVLAHRQELRGWTRKKAPGAPTRVQALAAHLLSEMKLPDGSRLLGAHWLDGACDRAAIEDWVFRVPHVATFLRVVIHQGFLVLCSSLDLATLVPECQVGHGRELESILDVLAVIFLNSCLAQGQRHRWRLLFSSQLHGQSFSQLCGHITHQGPCLTLLEDQDGHVFGGFASCSWEVKPQFQGDDRCFLFSISPSMAVYEHTGYNDHFMYLNCGQQTIPNGLMLTSGRDTARPSPRAPPTTARSCPPRRTSCLTRWRCGPWETPRSRSWSRAKRASSTLTWRPRPCWRSVGGLATAKGSGRPRSPPVRRTPRQRGFQSLDADVPGHSALGLPRVERGGLGPACPRWPNSVEPRGSPGLPGRASAEHPVPRRSLCCHGWIREVISWKSQVSDQQVNPRLCSRLINEIPRHRHLELRWNWGLWGCDFLSCWSSTAGHLASAQAILISALIVHLTGKGRTFGRESWCLWEQLPLAWNSCFYTKSLLWGGGWSVGDAPLGGGTSLVSGLCLWLSRTDLHSERWEKQGFAETPGGGSVANPHVGHPWGPEAGATRKSVASDTPGCWVEASRHRPCPSPSVTPGGALPRGMVGRCPGGWWGAAGWPYAPVCSVLWMTRVGTAASPTLRRGLQSCTGVSGCC